MAPPRPQPTEANHISVAAGQVFAGVGNGKIKRFTPAGALLEVLDTQSTFVFQDGISCASASAGRCWFRVETRWFA